MRSWYIFFTVFAIVACTSSTEKRETPEDKEELSRGAETSGVDDPSDDIFSENNSEEESGNIEEEAVGSIAGTTAAPVDSRKKALIIANGSYDKELTDWRPLSSLNDIPLIKTALENQGFSSSNISLIKDAKKDEMIAGILALEEKTNPGDIIVIHFSGHGQRIKDNNGDEADGDDESLVAIDGPARWNKIEGYDDYGHLRDDEFGELIAGIRQKAGKEGQVLVILDSCHSGTATRGFGTVRGGMPTLLATNEESSDHSISEESDMFESPKSRGQNDDQASFVLISAAMANQLNYEYEERDVGSLSYAFSKAMAEIGGEETYRSLFAKIAVTMAEIDVPQTPVIEGDMDLEVFGGEIKTQSPYFNITKLRPTDGDFNKLNGVIIDGGMIHGISQNSKVSLYKSGTINPGDEPENLLFEGTVSAIENFKAFVEFDDELTIKDETEAWAFVTELSFEGAKTNVSLDSIDNEDLKNLLTEQLGSQNIVNLTSGDVADVYLSDGNVRGSSIPLTIQTSNHEFSCNVRNGDVSGCVEQVKQLARGRFLKEIKFEDDNYGIWVEFIPIAVEETPSGGFGKLLDTLDIDDFMVNLVPTFPVGTWLMMNVINEGRMPVYYNILDIQPDGVINAVLPNARQGKMVDECRIEAGRSAIIADYYLKVGPPYGMETYKLFATRDPVNLEPIASSGGGKSRGNLDGLELMFNDVYGNSRGTTPFTSGGIRGSAVNMNFRIVEN